MKAKEIIEKILVAGITNSTCGVVSFDDDVMQDAIRHFGDFNACKLPKQFTTYVWVRHEIAEYPYLGEPDAFFLQGRLDKAMIVYLYELI